MRIVWCGRALAAWLGMAAGMQGQMVTGAKMPGYAEAFGLNGRDVEVKELSISTPSATTVNVLGDGEQPKIVFHVANRSNAAIAGEATVRVVHYGTALPEGELWKPHVFRIGEANPATVMLNIAKGGAQDVAVFPDVPAEYGGYAVVLDIPGHGSYFGATLARVIRPEPGRVQFPTYALDLDLESAMSEGVYTLFEKLGIKGARMGVGFNIPEDAAYKREQSRIEEWMGWAKKHDVTTMMTLGGGAERSVIQPLGRSRPWLTADGTMMKTKSDFAWLPKYDGEFEKWTAKLAADYGWPKGNLNAMELWNEPWDGISISGWGADIPRYRDIYTQMANGILEARKGAGVKVLIGGTSSSANARDKLFSDGTDRFLPIFDFVSIHYQALAADPILEKKWIARTGEYGPVKVWDTESWIANSEDRVAGVLASMRAQGQSRTAGVYRGNVYEASNYKLNGQVYPVVQAYSAAAAIGATQRFLGQRPFREILFRNGLPWVFVFDGTPDEGTGKLRAEDGTIVVVGDMKKIYPPNRTLFRSVKVEAKAVMEVKNPGGAIRVFDFYGNALPPTGEVVRVPLNGFGYFLRPDGTPGSFERLVLAVRGGTIKGVEPVEIVAHDLTSALGEHAQVRIGLTNVLNRAVAGRLTVEMKGLQVGQAEAIKLGANETRVVSLDVSGAAVASNTYALTARFDAGADGSADHVEDMHANVIAKRTIHVDGDLADWAGVLPEVVPGSGIGTSLTEKAYLPFMAEGETGGSGASTVWLAYDEKNFYFAAKITDTTPDEGMVRFATRDDDSYFYPDRVSTMDGKTEEWPAGVRHYSYRRKFEDPTGTSLHDNVQIAFNVVDPAAKAWLPYPPGTMPHFISYRDTDYEYALNPVAVQFGGGVELWRSLAPGVPIKTYFPREPRAAVDQGPVVGGQLVMRRQGDVRVVEAAIPWEEMPEVRRRVMAGETVKFSCRVNDNKGEARELGNGRSVSKENSPAFHDSWQTHWANEVEFGIGR